MQNIGFLLMCGGKSKRMGQPKGLLKVEDETLIQRISRAGKDFPERIFSVNNDIPVPEGFTAVADVYQNCGPMGGLHGALSHCQSKALVCAPCDTPFYSAELADFLAEQYTSEWDAVILRDAAGRVHPLMGVYGKSCLPEFTRCLEEDKLKLMLTLNDLRLKTIELPTYISQEVFINLNTPENYAQWVSKITK